MAKVLWLGDAGVHSGFGIVTHAIAERLVVRYGHEVHALAVNYKGDHFESNLKMYVPTKYNATDVYGQSRIAELMYQIQPDVVVILNDAPVIAQMLFNNKWDQDKVLLQARPIISYVPVDGINQPSTWRLVQEVTRVVLMSNFGTTWAPRSPVVHHGVDAFQFRPASDAAPLRSSAGKLVHDKRSAKEALGYDPDAFLIARVDRNSRRKDFASTWKALLPIVHDHDDVIVHFHCRPRDEAGYELGQMFSRHPGVARRFYVPGQDGVTPSWTREDMAILYNAADLFVSTSWGEGFGLTLAESVACGTPVVAQAVSSITEVVGPGGVLLKPKGTITVPSGQDQWLPDIDAFTSAIDYLYAAEQDRLALGAKGRAHVESMFSWDDAARAFDRLIAKEIEAAENGESDE